jgi:hypothetical protein
MPLGLDEADTLGPIQYTDLLQHQKTSKTVGGLMPTVIKSIVVRKHFSIEGWLRKREKGELLTGFYCDVPQCYFSCNFCKIFTGMVPY